MYFNVRKRKTLNLPVGDGTKQHFYGYIFCSDWFLDGFATLKGQNPTEDSLDVTHGTGSCGSLQLQSD